MAVSEQDLATTVAGGLAQCRELIAPSVHRRIGAYAALINLSCAVKTQEFENDVIEAILWCAVAHMDESNRKRHSHIRKALLRIAREAGVAEKSLEGLRTGLHDLPPQYREIMDTQLESVAKIATSLIVNQAPWFYALSSIAEMAGFIAGAMSGKDKGGAPEMLAFRTLIKGLKRAFERATGSAAAVTWDPRRSRYEGKFVNLVEAVLPLAVPAAGEERPMRCPAFAKARGKYIHKMTVVPRSKKRNA
jgi:hypothetical protein